MSNNVIKLFDDDDGEDFPRTRTIKSYPVSESELELLAWAPFWIRRRMIRRIRRETVFDQDAIA